jgi:hypothetical protein
MTGPWQALVAEVRIGGHKLSIAVGREVDRSERLTVQSEREGKRDGGYLVIPVIANVGCSRHNRTSDLGNGDLAR